MDNFKKYILIMLFILWNVDSQPMVIQQPEAIATKLTSGEISCYLEYADDWALVDTILSEKNVDLLVNSTSSLFSSKNLLKIAVQKLAQSEEEIIDLKRAVEELLNFACRENLINLTRAIIKSELIDPEQYKFAFLVAAKNGKENISILQLFLDAGVDPNFKTWNGGNTALIYIMKSLASCPAAELLINAGAKLEVTNYKGETALLVAIKHKIPAHIIELLLKRTANPNCRDIDGETPLNLAITTQLQDKESSEINKYVTLLLAHGADSNGKNRQGETPLIRAIEGRCPKLVKLLLYYKANANLSGKVYKSEVRIDSSRRPVEEVTSILSAPPCTQAMMFPLIPLFIGLEFLQTASEVSEYFNKDNYKTITPMVLAIERGYEEIVEVLVKVGEAKSRNNLSEVALCAGNIEIAIRLIEAGGDLNYSAFNYAIRYHCIAYIDGIRLIKKVMELAIKNNDFDKLIEICNQCAETKIELYGIAIECAINNENKGILRELILKKGTDLKKSHIESGLNIALNHNDIDYLLIILNNLKRPIYRYYSSNENVDFAYCIEKVFTHYMQTGNCIRISRLLQAINLSEYIIQFIYKAICTNNTPILRVLIEAVESDQKIMILTQAFFYAIEINNKIGVEFLIDIGADVNSTQNGKTAIAIALGYKYTDLAKFLKSKGAAVSFLENFYV